LREKQGRRGEMLPKPKNVEFGSLLGVICSLYLQYMSLPCKNSKQKLAGNAAKNTKKVTEIFCVYTENFQQTNMIDK
jgi:hypothetical protein